MLVCDPAGVQPARWVWLRRLLIISALSYGALALASCQAKPALELLQVSAIVPDELQFGDRFQVIGDGFALGSAATVRLSGSVHRAGQADQTVDLKLAAETESQRELGVVLPGGAQATLAGEPDAASHVTFRGDVQVAIAAKLRGEPPVTGTLHGAVLELYPANQTRAAEERLKLEGQRALAFFGVEASLAADGLTVVRVAAGSRAASADLKPGDRFLRAAGVSVQQPSDLVPAPGRRLDVVVQRGASERAIAFDVDGFSRAPARGFNLAAVMVAGAALVLLISASPGLAIVAWLSERWMEQRRAHLELSRPRARASAPKARAAIWLDRVSDGVGALVWLAIGAALLSPALRSAPVDLTLGLLGLCFAASTLLAAAALVRGGRRHGSWSLLAGLRAVRSQCLVVAPGWVALLSVCNDAGVDFRELAVALGHLPWAWKAFSNPGFSLSFVLLLATALPRVSPSPFRLQRAAPPLPPARSRADDLFGWLYLCSTCGVAASAFLGADAWPGMALHATRGVEHATLLAGLALLVKYTGLVLLMLLLRRLCAGITSEEWARVSLRICLPLSLLAVALAHAFRALRSLSPFWDWIGGGFGPALFVALLLGASVVVWRAASFVARPAASLAPWS